MLSQYHLRIRNLTIAKGKIILYLIFNRLGADYTINYKTNPDFSKLVLEYTNGKGADVIADPVCASNVN